MHFHVFKLFFSKLSRFTKNTLPGTSVWRLIPTLVHWIDGKWHLLQFCMGFVRSSSLLRMFRLQCIFIKFTADKTHWMWIPMIRKKKNQFDAVKPNRTQRQNSSWTYRFTLMFFILQLCMMVWYTFLYHHEAGSDWSILLGKKPRRETCLWQWERYTLQMPLLIFSYMAFKTML